MQSFTSTSLEQLREDLIEFFKQFDEPWSTIAQNKLSHETYETLLILAKQKGFDLSQYESP